MNVTVIEWPPLIVEWTLAGIPIVYLILLLGIGFMIIGFFVRSPFVYLAALCCMAGVLFSGIFGGNFWAMAALTLICIWALLATIITVKRGVEG